MNYDSDAAVQMMIELCATAHTTPILLQLVVTPFCKSAIADRYSLTAKEAGAPDALQALHGPAEVGAELSVHDSCLLRGSYPMCVRQDRPPLCQVIAHHSI